MNESLSKAENLDRELNTQKEIMRQLESSKKEYIDKLKRELDSIEEKWQAINNENCMVGEDYRSQAFELTDRIVYMNQVVQQRESALLSAQETVDYQKNRIENLDFSNENNQMKIEDLLVHLKNKVD